MPRDDWIAKYPKVQQLLQQPEEVLEYRPEGEAVVSEINARKPVPEESATFHPLGVPPDAAEDSRAARPPVTLLPLWGACGHRSGPVS